MNFRERKAELDSSRIPGHSSQEDSSTFSVIWQEALVPKTQFKDARISGQQQASILVSKKAVNMVPSLTVILQCCQLGSMGKRVGDVTSLPWKALQIASDADEITSEPYLNGKFSTFLTPEVGSTDFFILSRMTFMCSSAAFTRDSSIHGQEILFYAYTCMLLRAGSDMCVPGPR